MNKKNLEELKQKLLKEKKEVEKNLAIISDKDVGDHVPGDYAAKFPNYGDDHYTELEDNSPTEVADYSVNVNSTGELEEHFKNIQIALEKIEMDKFGHCEKCKQSISEDRLKVNPAARICMNCAEQ